jgi:hypothetical protein
MYAPTAARGGVSLKNLLEGFLLPLKPRAFRRPAPLGPPLNCDDPV